MRTTIVRRRQEIRQRLSRSLGPDFIAVASPDHPLVMRCVDVLVGGRSGLMAVMMMTVQEIRRPSLFMARLTLNKAALPSHAKFVFVAVGDERPYIHLPKAFSAELSLQDSGVRDELVKLAADPRQLRGTGPSEKEAKAVQSRFGDTYKLARVLQRSPRKNLQPMVRRRSSRPHHDILAHNVEGAFFVEPPSQAALSEVFLEGADRWYHLTEGDFGPTEASAGALFADDVPRPVGDPDKVTRAAAFAGWVIAPRQSTRSLDDVADLISRYTRLR